LVWPGRCTERQRQVRLVAQADRKPVGAADDKHRRRLGLHTPSLDVAGKGRARQALAPGIHQDRDGALRNDIGDGDRFFEHPAGRIVGAALPDLDDIEAGEPTLRPVCARACR
jgi:hypothetical protein